MPETWDKKFRATLSPDNIFLTLPWISAITCFFLIFESTSTWYFDEFLKAFELSKEEFFKIVDKFANHSLFKKNSSGELFRDDEGNLELLEPPH